MASPELVYLRMAGFVDEVQLAEIRMNLCGRYYISDKIDDLPIRSEYLTTPKKLKNYCLKCNHIRGSVKAINALRWVLPNSASPVETKTQLLYSISKVRGGFSLPLTHLNYDIKAGRLARITEQSEYSIDSANPDLKVGLEYDGGNSHQDVSKDKRRRNELSALGWNIYPLDKSVLYNPEKSERHGHLLARAMGVRLRLSSNWPRKYSKLRNSLGLPY